MKEIFYNGNIITMEEPDVESAKRNAPEAVLVEGGIGKRLNTGE